MGQKTVEGSVSREHLVASVPLLIIAGLLIALTYIGAKYYQSLVTNQYDNLNDATDGLVHISPPGVTAGASTTSPSDSTASQSGSPRPVSTTPKTKAVTSSPEPKSTSKSSPSTTSSKPIETTSSSASRASSSSQSSDTTPSSPPPKPGTVPTLLCNLGICSLF